MTKILVVDDEEDYSFIIKKVLAKAGFEVLLASDGAAGLAAAIAEKPDLILLDINMPGLNGYEVAEKIRQEENIRNTPIIMLTVRSKEDDQVKGFTLGSDDYIIKPFAPAELLSRIRNLLKFKSEVPEHEN